MKTKVKATDYVNHNVSPDSEDYFDFESFTKDFLSKKSINAEAEGEKQVFDQQKYMNTYNKEHYKRVTVLVPKEEENILAFLKTKKPVSAYILGLIRDDMEKNIKK